MTRAIKDDRLTSFQRIHIENATVLAELDGFGRINVCSTYFSDFFKNDGRYGCGLAHRCKGVQSNDDDTSEQGRHRRYEHLLLQYYVVVYG